MSTNRIGDRLGISKNTASRVVNQAGVSRYKRFAKEAPRIVALYKRGLSGPKIATKLGTTPTTIYGKLAEAGINIRKWVKPATECDHQFFDKIDTALKAYLLGWIVTDGCIHISTRVRKHDRRWVKDAKRRRARRYELILSVHPRDRQILVLLKRAVRAVATVTTAKTITKEINGKQHETRETRITIRSREMVNTLLTHGIMNRKTGRTTMPSGIPDELLPHFWRGAIEGDGWIFLSKRRKKGGRRQLTLGFTGDRPIVEAFRTFCQRYTPTRANIHANGKKVVRFCVTDWFAYDVARVLFQDVIHGAPERKYLTYSKAIRYFETRTRRMRDWSRRNG